MAREKANQGLVSRYDQLAEVVPEADRKLVFGSPCCLVGGHILRPARGRRR